MTRHLPHQLKKIIFGLLSCLLIFKIIINEAIVFNFFHLTCRTTVLLQKDKLKSIKVKIKYKKINYLGQLVDIS
jgi:hypothetical protein